MINRLQRGRGVEGRASEGDHPRIEKIVLPALPPAPRRQLSAGEEAAARVGLRLSGHRYPSKPVGIAQRRTLVLRGRRGCSLRPRGKCTTALRRPHGGHHVHGGIYIYILEGIRRCYHANFVIVSGSSEQGVGRVRAKSRQAQESATARAHMVDRDVAHPVRVRDDRVPDGRLRVGVLAAGKNN